MGFGRLEKGARLFLLGLLFVNLKLVQSDHFLREPTFTDIQQEERRPKREVLEWQEEWREKARSFGQSPEERAIVHQYIDRLNAVARDRYPNNAQARALSNMDVSFFPTFLNSH